jgi:hypothetical protein
MRRDGGHERVIRRKDAVIPVPVLARRRHEVGEPVEKLKRREVDDDARPAPRGLSAVAAECGPLAPHLVLAETTASRMASATTGSGTTRSTTPSSIAARGMP